MGDSDAGAGPEEFFGPDAQGFVRHWLYVGPKVTRYEGTATGEEAIRR